MAEVVKRLSLPKSRSELVRQLGISRFTLYYQPKLPAKDLALKAEIEKVMIKHKSYGHKRIALHLKINKKRALRVMKLFNLKVKRRRKALFKKKDICQPPMAISNLVMGTAVSYQHQIWVSDFTYLPYYGKTIYLATVEDVFTRQVVGWSVANRHNANLVASALLDAIIASSQKPKIMHSDQGSEYRDRTYLNLFKSLKIKPSMSKKASPWENGYQESFYSGFKLELGHPEAYQDPGELIEAIAQQIYYYNNHRIHTALKCPPAIFAQRLKQQNTRLINREITMR